MGDARHPVRAQYDGYAPTYDERWAGYVAATNRLLLDAAGVEAHERVLELGCGTGTLAARLLDAFPSLDYVGVDLSEGMLAEARRKLAGHASVRFERADARALPFPDQSFDVVLSASALHYIPAPDRALGEAGRVLRPGGRLVLLDWRRDAFGMGLYERVVDLVDPAHARTLSLLELDGALRRAGFRDGTLRPARYGLWGLMIADARR